MTGQDQHSSSGEHSGALGSPLLCEGRCSGDGHDNQGQGGREDDHDNLDRNVLDLGSPLLQCKGGEEGWQQELRCVQVI